jgi:hypothetical protein
MSYKGSGLLINHDVIEPAVELVDKVVDSCIEDIITYTPQAKW